MKVAVISLEMSAKRYYATLLHEYPLNFSCFDMFSAGNAAC